MPSKNSKYYDDEDIEDGYNDDDDYYDEEDDYEDTGYSAQ